jgi:hypothetical protein
VFFLLLGALGKGFKEIAKHPLCILPAIVASAVIAIVFLAVVDFFIDIVINAVFLGNVPDSGLSELPFQFFYLYAGNLVLLFLASLVSLIVIIATSFFYSNYAKGLLEKKPSISKAISKTIEQGGQIIALFVFALVFAAVIGIIFWGLLLSIPLAGLWPLVLMFLLAIVIVYALAKIAFVIPAMACEGEKLKAAIGKSWEFSNKKFWTALLFLMLVLIINQIIFGIGSAISGLVADEVISAILFAVFLALASAYSALAMTFYYLGRE